MQTLSSDLLTNDQVPILSNNNQQSNDQIYDQYDQNDDSFYQNTYSKKINLQIFKQDNSQGLSLLQDRSNVDDLKNSEYPYDISMMIQSSTVRDNQQKKSILTQIFHKNKEKANERRQIEVYLFNTNNKIVVQVNTQTSGVGNKVKDLISTTLNKYFLEYLEFKPLHMQYETFEIKLADLNHQDDGHIDPFDQNLDLSHILKNFKGELVLVRKKIIFDYERRKIYLNQSKNLNQRNDLESDNKSNSENQNQNNKDSQNSEDKNQNDKIENDKDKTRNKNNNKNKNKTNEDKNLKEQQDKNIKKYQHQNIYKHQNENKNQYNYQNLKQNQNLNQYEYQRKRLMKRKKDEKQTDKQKQSTNLKLYESQNQNQNENENGKYMIIRYFKEENQYKSTEKLIKINNENVNSTLNMVVEDISKKQKLGQIFILQYSSMICCDGKQKIQEYFQEQKYKVYQIYQKVSSYFKGPSIRQQEIQSLKYAGQLKPKLKVDLSPSIWGKSQILIQEFSITKRTVGGILGYFGFSKERIQKKSLYNLVQIMQTSHILKLKFLLKDGYQIINYEFTVKKDKQKVLEHLKTIAREYKKHLVFK